ncbi:hypothetical protein LQW54_002976 [Pestalotiopsis sp. IQ-011]
MVPREAIVAQAVNQLHTSLGILLGAGQISGITHEQILALINSNEDRHIVPTAGKETPVSVASHELESSLNNLRIAKQEVPREPRGSISSGSHLNSIEDSWRNHQSAAPAPTEARSRSTNIVCPRKCMGYKCKEKECTWEHDDIPGGIKEPLICAFWAGGDLCNKSPEDCRYAHHWAAHREIAPQPPSKNAYWKAKKAKSQAASDARLPPDPMAKYSEAGTGSLLD